MAEASISVDQNHFSCAICLHVVTDPVTIPCGHTFCMGCIDGFWDQEAQKGEYTCPQCRETFYTRPVLRKNNMLTGIVDVLQKTGHQASLPKFFDLLTPDSQDVECDFCIGVKNNAVKSCLTCLASYCEVHVEAHHKSAAFMKHTLISAVSNLQEKTCSQHNKLLEVFCRTDQTTICYQCSMDNHKGHDTISVQEEWINKKKHFADLKVKYQNQLERREKTLQELKQLVDSYKLSAQQAVEDSEKIFSELVLSIQRRCLEMTELIRAQEKAELDQTTGLIEKLECEIADLKRREEELEKLSQTSGYVHFLQKLQFVSPELGNEDSLKIAFNQQWSFEKFTASLSQLKEEIEGFCKEKFEMVSENMTFGLIVTTPDPETREEFLRYSCELFMDPKTVNNSLTLSDGDTQVKHDGKFYQYFDHPDRFTAWNQVLCKHSVPSRSYWEAVVDGEYGVSIAVSYKTITRAGSDKKSRFGHNTQSWRLVRYPTYYCFWHNNKKIDISSPVSKRIGVYVDQKAGSLSFYNVTDRMTLIHRVTTTFTQPLYAGFGIGSGSYAKICLQASGESEAAFECGKKNKW